MCACVWQEGEGVVELDVTGTKYKYFQDEFVAQSEDGNLTESDITEEFVVKPPPPPAKQFFTLK